MSAGITSGIVTANNGLAPNPSTRIVPTTGNSVTIPDGNTSYVIEPAGTLAALTITMPTNPFDTQLVRIASTQIVTTLTHNAGAGQTLKGALTTIAANGFATYEYLLATTTWYRIG